MKKEDNKKKEPHSDSVERAFDIVKINFTEFETELLIELYQRIRRELDKRGYIA